MIVSVKQFLAKHGAMRWAKLSEEETQAVIDSIPGENMVRNAPHNKMDGATVGDNLRHYVDRGYLVVHGFGQEAEKHPLDVQARARELKIEAGAPAFASV
jgi:hypothetical protein